MSGNKKSKKLDLGDGFSIGDSSDLKISIGLLTGKDTDSTDKLAPSQEIRSSACPHDLKITPTETISKLSQVTLQRQTAGRGGKTVTVVILQKDAEENLSVIAKEMRKGLGCGSFVEEGRIILQGDICDRTEEWLLKKGVKRVLRGN